MNRPHSRLNLVGLLLLTGALSCSPVNPPDTHKPPKAPLCDSMDADVQALGPSVSAALQGQSGSTIRAFGDQLDALDKLTKTLCQAPPPPNEAQLAACARIGVDSLEALEKILALAAQSALPPDSVAWIVESKRLQMEEATLCQAAGSVTMGELKLDARGALKKSGVYLQTRSQAPVALDLKATLVCQRQSAPDQWEDLPDCNLAQARAFDRFRVDFETSALAHVYLLMFNGSGQFQTLFPDKGVPNKVTARNPFTLPAPDDWWQFDEVTGVTEHIQLIASAHPVVELERLRGLDFSPRSQGTSPRVALRARGKMEPLIARSVRPKEGQRQVLLPDGTLRQGDLNTSGKDIVGVEFAVYRTP